MGIIKKYGKRILTFRRVLEGVVKFNLILFIVCIALFYFRILLVSDYFHFMKNQAVLIVLVYVFGKCYEWLRFEVPFNKSQFRKETLFLMTVLAVFFVYLCSLLLKYLPIKIETAYLFIYHLVIAMVYWIVIILLYKAPLLKRLIVILDTCFSYKDFLRLFLIFNIVFFMVILVILMGASHGKNILEVIFTILYFEISFLIFHIASAHLFDVVWLPSCKKNRSVSLFGICVGSITYVLKLNVIDRKLMGSFVKYDENLLIAIVALILFWVFFTLLFHLEEKYILKGRKEG